MMKTLGIMIVALLSLFVGCSGCVTDTWDARGDVQAACAQRLMRHTVQVDHVLGFMVPDPDGNLQPIERPIVGTGTVVAKSGGRSAILTAGHICVPQDSLPLKGPDGQTTSRPVLTERFVVWDMEVKQIPAEVAYLDTANDLCVIVAEGDAGTVSPVLERDPPVGAVVTHVGSPLAIINWHRAYVQDGRYLGIRNTTPGVHQEVFALPVTHGSSGGGIFYGGKIFGVMIMSSEGFGQISIGVSDQPFAMAVRRAREVLRK